MKKISKAKDDLISIIIPVYNVERYLNRCLISVVNQSYNNLQIIVIDDGSIDNSGKICDEWAQKDKRIEVIHQENSGLSNAKNKGLSKARGEYVFFVDSDDWISLNMVERMNDAMISNNADMVICQCILTYSNGHNIHKKPTHGTQVLNVEQTVKLFLEDKQITNHVFGKMYKRSLLPNDLFPINKNFEDIYVMPSLFLLCQRIICLDESYYYYYQYNLESAKLIDSNNCCDYYIATKHNYEIMLYNFPNLKNELNLTQLRTNLIILNDLKKEKSTAKTKKLIKLLIKECRQLSKNKYFGLEDYILYYVICFCPILYSFIYSVTKFINKVFKKIKSAHRYFVMCKDIIKIKQRRFFIISTPNYGNLGDQALLIGEHLFIKENFPNYVIIDIPTYNLNILSMILLKLCIRKKDYVSIQAGGNFGTLYLGLHKAQEEFIYILRKHNLFIFPQTFYYSEDKVGQCTLKKTKQVYHRCKNLVVTVREKKSYDFVRENFPDTKVMMLPDMVLNIPKYETDYKRNGALLCLRNDSEKTVSEYNYEKILSTLKGKFNHVEQADTNIYYCVSDIEAREQIEILWNKMAKSQLVITDRLHGMIFAAITQTPCVVILSKSHKIKGCYEWIKDLGYISLVEDIDELPNVIDKLLKIKNPTYNNKQIKLKYQELVEELKLWM